LLAVAPAAFASPLVNRIVLPNTDVTSAGVAGVGSSSSGGGTGVINIGGVSGSVTKALLVWNGIGDKTAGGPYTPSTVQVNGTSVTGSSMGESGSNCWGKTVTSRTYMADVTAIVKAAGGNGAYTITGLGPGNESGNGAHIVVSFDDGNAANNRDVYVFLGNDSNSGGPNLDNYPGEDNVWNDNLTSMNYQGGAAHMLLAVSDGQSFPDGDLTVTGAHPVVFPDNATQFDGNVLPDMGHSRAPNGSLYDLQTFDVTGAFGPPGVQTLNIGAPLASDCLAITMAAVDVAATGNPSQPPVTVSINPGQSTDGTPPPGKQNNSLKMAITLNRPTNVPVTVKLKTFDGTATSPLDYQGKPQTLTIPAGQTQVLWGIDVLPDTISEPNEFFYGEIMSATNAVIGTNTAVATILAD
jgi:hypothetical protein